MTSDAFLDGRLTLRQSAAGFRAGLDSVMLAAAVNPKRAARVLDLGCGAGAAALCLLTRRPDLSVTGLEPDEEARALCALNAEANAKSEQLRILAGSVERPPRSLSAMSFDAAMMNPPFFVEGKEDAAPDPAKAAARRGGAALLRAFIALAQRRVAPGGTLTAILPAARLVETLAAMTEGFGAIVIFPLWPKAGLPAKRVLVSGVKGRKTPLRLSTGLVLHQSNGRPTAEADAILRDAAPLVL